MEELLLDKVKEIGIVKIIIEYKIEFETFELKEIRRNTIMRIIDDMIKEAINFL